MNRISLVWFTVVLLLVMKVSGCSDAADEAVIPPPEPQYPSPIKSISPRSNAQNVDIGAGVSIAFSKNMNPATITNETIKFETASGNVVFDAGSNTATLTLNQGNFDYGQTYTVILSPTIEAVDEETLKLEFKWSFTTNAQPSVISSVPSLTGNDTIPYNVNPVITFSEAIAPGSLTGNITFVDENANPVNFSSSFSQDGTELTIVPTNPLRKDSNYSLSLSDQIQDLQNTNLSQAIQINFSTQAPQVVDFLGESSANYPAPRIAYDDLGNAAGFWKLFDGVDYIFTVAHYNMVTQTWGPMHIVHRTPKAAYDAVLVFGNRELISVSDSSTVVVWRENGIIKARHYDGNTWSDIQDIASVSNNDIKMSLTNSFDNHLLTWMDNGVVYANVNTGLWSTTKDLSSIAGDPATAIEYKVATAENIFTVAWVKEASGTCPCQRYFYSNRFDGIWATLTETNTTATDMELKELFTNPNGRDWVFYIANGATKAAEYRADQFGGFWNDITLPFTGPDSITGWNNGQKMLVWHDTATSDINVSRYVGNAWEPPAPINAAATSPRIMKAIPSGTGFAVFWNDDIALHANEIGAVPSTQNDKSVAFNIGISFMDILPTNTGFILLMVEQISFEDIFYSVAYDSNWNTPYSFPFSATHLNYQDKIMVENNGASLFWRDPSGLPITQRIALGNAQGAQTAMPLQNIPGRPLAISDQIVNDNNEILLTWTQTHGAGVKSFAKVFSGGNWQNHIDLGMGEVVSTRRNNQFLVVYGDKDSNTIYLKRRLYDQGWQNEQVITSVTQGGFATNRYYDYRVLSNNSGYFISWLEEQFDGELIYIYFKAQTSINDVWKDWQFTVADIYDFGGFNYSISASTDSFGFAFDGDDRFGDPLTARVMVPSNDANQFTLVNYDGDNFDYADNISIQSNGSNFLMTYSDFSIYFMSLFSNNAWSSTIMFNTGTNLTNNIGYLSYDRSGNSFTTNYHNGAAWDTEKSFTVNNTGDTVQFLGKAGNQYEALILTRSAGRAIITTRNYPGGANANWSNPSTLHQFTPADQNAFTMAPIQDGDQTVLIWGDNSNGNFYTSTLSNSWSTPLHLSANGPVDYQVNKFIRFVDQRTHAAWIDSARTTVKAKNEFRLIK